MTCLKIALLTLLFQLSFGQQAPKVNKKVYTAKSLGALPAPVINGLLTDESWNIVEWTGDYIENLPDENGEPIEPTKIQSGL
ncbi:hypothetical protein [Flavobacterium limi]|uniref:Uncharacterized protein n=1 Tax=Flavobacterium limi TaxID=2045105 RepID=A0ABQ1TXZ6_9FLAO|nr:hypothetical protein [Flavobacterium limi]GGF05264.1 hypothetical protein GCM10011518_13080 [Flavobacterium limi]